MPIDKSTVFIYKDEDGELALDVKNGVIELRLANERPKVRGIGCIARNKQNKSLSYYKEDREHEIFRKNNSWSINWNILKFLPKPESTINILTEKCIYRITKQTAMNIGSFLYFKEQGIEKKFYIPKESFTIEDL